MLKHNRNDLTSHSTHKLHYLLIIVTKYEDSEYGIDIEKQEDQDRNVS